MTRRAGQGSPGAGPRPPPVPSGHPDARPEAHPEARLDARPGTRLDARLDARFEALVLGWAGTLVPDGRADASAARARLEGLLAGGVHVFVVTDDAAGRVDRQLRARPRGPGRLFLCAEGGSEVVEVGHDGPVLVRRRTVSPEEERRLARAAALAVDGLRATGIEVGPAAGRPGRRTIDLVLAEERAGLEGAGPSEVLAVVGARLRRSGLDLRQVAALVAAAARRADLPEARVVADAGRLELGMTDASDAASYAATWLAERGVTGSLVLVAGQKLGPHDGVAGTEGRMLVEALARCRAVSVGAEPDGVPAGVVHLAGGPDRLLELLDDQLDRRRARRVPEVDPDPRWVVPVGADDLSIGVAESIGVLANGWAATRGSTEERTPGSSPQFLVSGVYGRHGLVPGPIWTELVAEEPAGQRPGQPAGQRPGQPAWQPAGPGPGTRAGALPVRVLDLRTGTLYRPGPGIRSLRFVSALRPHTMALRAEADGREAGGSAGPVDPLALGDGGASLGSHDGSWEARTSSSERRIHVAARDRTTDRRKVTTVERIAAWSTGTQDAADGRCALDHLGVVDRMGYDALLAEHRQEWARRWGDAEVVIEGGPEAAADELASRFAVFNLLAAAADAGESAVGARGLTGTAYAGHVFWDADVFVLPALAAIRPAAARSMLEYRIRRLPAARREARARGRAGARFPWESAAEGRDVTPRVVRGPRGRHIPILTGLHEEHIVADVAWAAAHYAAWSGDRAFLAGGPGEPLLVETARYWASRARVDPAGRAHLYGAMGPDEYHEVVDDNAFTNAMARWNLRAGAAALRRHGGVPDEAVRWEQLASALVDGWDPTRGVYEQFAGYFGLEDVRVADFAEPPVAIDVLLGHDRVARSQLIKQADVLMLHHLLPTQAVAGSLGACLAYYEPRTAHGSSLSPAVSAALLARAGRPDEGLALFRLASRLDLDDVTGTTAGGLHLATMGGVWQALAFGFLGLRAEDHWLAVRPSLPHQWSRLSLRLRFRGRAVRVAATAREVTVDCDGPLAVRVGDGEVLACAGRGVRAPIVEGGRHER